MIGEVRIRSDYTMPDMGAFVENFLISHSSATISVRQANSMAGYKHYCILDVMIPDGKHTTRRILHKMIQRALYWSHFPDAEYMFQLRKETKTKVVSQTQWQSYKSPSLHDSIHGTENR